MLFHRRQLERDLEDEMRFHMEMQAEEGGDSRPPLGRFGNPEALKEATRDLWRFVTLETLWQDVRHALRWMRRSPGFVAVAVTTLALGIGANTAVFSLLSALLLRPWPVEHGRELVGVYGTMDGRVYGDLPYAVAAAYRRRTQVFSGIALHSSVWIWMDTPGGPLEVLGGAVSPDYFGVLGVRPVRGRFFLPEEDVTPGGHPVTILGYRVWKRHFDGDPTIVGKTVRLNRGSFTVIGVAPEELERATSQGAWIPAMMRAGGNPQAHLRREGWMEMVGRLQAGRTIDEARAEAAVLAQRLATHRLESGRKLGVFVAAVRGAHPGRRSENQTEPLLAAAVAAVLLIACANLAGLLIARGAARRREVAIRLALGASRLRLIRQLLTESILLALAGGVAGLAVAWWAFDFLVSFYRYRVPNLELTLDSVVLTAGGCLSILTGVVLGLAPALDVTSGTLVPGLKEGEIAMSPRRARLRSALVITQAGVSVTLLACAGVLLQSARHVATHPGFDQDGVLQFRLRPSRVGYTAEKAAPYHRRLIRSLGELPGVEAVVLATVPPDRMFSSGKRIALPGWPDVIDVAGNDVTPGFLETLRIPLLHGRSFQERDQAGAPLVVAVSETLARQLWPGRPAVGETLVVNRQAHTVIGVAQDAVPRRGDEASFPYLYLSYWQIGAVDCRLLVRVKGDPHALLPKVRQAIVALDSDVHIGQEMTLAERTALSFEGELLLSNLLTLAAGVALSLCALGIYGTLAYAVSRRTKEIAVRMALGARRQDVLRMVITQGLHLMLAGWAIGIAGALAATRLLTAHLYGVAPWDLRTGLAVSALLALVVLAACYGPARRAAAMDPLSALRWE
jgi:predicted permease